MSRFIFDYENFFTGKVRKRWMKPRNKPFSLFLKKGEYSKRGVTIKYINQIVAAAKNGEFISSVDVLLVMAHFLENEWPIPQTLSKYTAKTLQNTVIAFGHTDGGTNERNAEIAKALGLVVPRGNAKKSNAMRKKLLVHLYISWRKKIYGENLYTAAKYAMVAFNGTKGLSQDYCEKIYNEVETQKDESPYNLFDCDLRDFFYGQIDLKFVQPAFFDDDEFLKALIPYAEDDKTKERWLGLLDRGKNRKNAAAARKKTMIQLYISWRQKLYGENLYTAVGQAMVAFKGTEGLSKDYCEKIYNEFENQEVEDSQPDLKLFFFVKNDPLMIHPAVFNDDDFLKALIPHAEDESTSKFWLELFESAR